MRVSYTILQADAAGTVTARGAEPGEVVQAGQMIVTIARKDGRDAVFDVPAQVLRSAPSDPRVVVRLTDDPSVMTTGRVREVAPQADPVTRTFAVRVGLTDPPAAMRLGATVNGSMRLEADQVISIPASALTEFNRQPAVWVVDPEKLTVSLRNIETLALRPGDRRRSRMGWSQATSSSPPASRRCIPARRSACWDPPPSGPQSLQVGARAPVVRRLPDDRLRSWRGCRRSSASAATRIRPSSSRPWWCRPRGPARPSTTPSSR